MDIKDIQYVNAIIEWNSFSKAAKQLYISQPALSQSIKRLENELGVTLFMRDRNYVAPTNAALLIHQQSQPILEAFRQLQNELAKYTQAPSTVTLGISQFYGHHLLSVILPHFNANRPDIKLTLMEGESHFIETQINLGRIDIGIFPVPLLNTNLTHYELYTERLLLAIPTENKTALSLATKALNAKEKAVLIDSFRDYPFILLKPNLKFRNFANRLFHHYHITPHVVAETENIDTCLSLAASNYGLTLVPNTILLNETPPPSIQFFPLVEPFTTRSLLLVSTEQIAKKLKLNEYIPLLRHQFSTYNERLM